MKAVGTTTTAEDYHLKAPPREAPSKWPESKKSVQVVLFSICEGFVIVLVSRWQSVECWPSKGPFVTDTCVQLTNGVYIPH